MSRSVLLTDQLVRSVVPYMHGESGSSVGLHEDLFVARYDMLRRWARRLVGRDRWSADDLVHAAFERFVIRRPPLTSIGNLDTYLFSLVRNLRVSEARRASSQLTESCTPLDDDIAVADVRDAAAAGRREAQDTLLTICEYAVGRQYTSKAGSVLLLRFLWGYYPAEIARLARTSAPTVNQWLKIARREARDYLNDAHSVPSMDHVRLAWRAASTAAARSSDDFVHGLRLALARIRQEDCPLPEWYAALYARAGSESVDCGTLAHLACCAACQHVVVGQLGLRTPDDPSDHLGRNNRSEGGRARPTARRSVRTRRSPATVGRAALRVVQQASQRMFGWLAPMRVPLKRLAVVVPAIVATIVVWNTFDRSATKVSAASLLRDLRTAESAFAQAPDVATHRTVMLEQRRLPQGHVVKRQRIETWQGADRRVRARRVYDDQQRVVGGEWTTHNGASTIYAPQVAPRVESPATAVLLSADTAWRWEPSAMDFSRLGITIDQTTIDERMDAYVLRFQAPPSDIGEGVLEATLTVSKADRRAVEQRVIVRDATEVHEYHFAEVGFERLPAADVPRDIFEPERELLGPTPVVWPAVSERSRPARPASSAFDARLDGVEMSALFGLHRLESCLVDVPRVSRGSRRLRVEARVRDVVCHEQAQILFSGIDPSVVDLRLDVRAAATADDGGGLLAEPQAARERPVAKDASVAASGEASELPATSEESEARLRQIRTQFASLHGHALAVQRLAYLWPLDRLQRLDAADLMMWQGMIRDHAWHVREQMRSLVVTIQQGAQQTSTMEPPSPHVIARDTHVAAIHDLRDVAPAADELVRSVAECEALLMRGHGVPESLDALHQASRVAASFLEIWALNVAPDTER